MKTAIATASLAFATGVLVGGAVVWLAAQPRRRIVEARASTVEIPAEVSPAALVSSPRPDESHALLDASARDLAESEPQDAERSPENSLSTLEARLLELHRDGTIPSLSLAQIVIPLLAARERTDEALELIAPFPSNQRGGLYIQIVARMRLPQQAELRRFWIDQAVAAQAWSLEVLTRFEPLRALSEMDARVARNGGVVPADIKFAYMHALAAQNRPDEARALAEQILSGDPHNGSALSVLARVDLDAAAEHYRALIAARDEQGDWQRSLFDLYLNGDRPYQAESALRAIEQSAGRVDADDWGQLAQSYAESGDEARAVDYWVRAFQLETSDPDDWTEALQERAPEQLLQLLEERVQHPVSDEFWGALGDARWRAGRRDDALAAWREARRLDPSDDEWKDKLAAAESGEDPLDD